MRPRAVSLLWRGASHQDIVFALCRARKVRFAFYYSVCNPPKARSSSGPSLDGQDLQVPRDRKGVHPGLAVRPRTPGPHPLSGGLNETALESHLIRGLLVVQINWSWHAPSCRGFVPPQDSAAEFLLDTSRLPFYRLSAERSPKTPFWHPGRRTPSPPQGESDVPSCRPNGSAHLRAQPIEFGNVCCFGGATNRSGRSRHRSRQR